MIEQVNSLARLWLGWMWPMVWQVGVLVGVVWLIDLLVRRWVWPQVRYALWLLVLLKLILPPGLTSPASITSGLGPVAGDALQRTVTAEQVSTGETEEAELLVEPPGAALHPEGLGAAPVAAEAIESGSSGALETEGAQMAAVQGGGAVLSWYSYAMFAWLVGVVMLAGWLVVRFKQLSRKHGKRTDAVEPPGWFGELLAESARKLKLGRLPRVVLSESAVSPAVFGVFRPVLLIPAEGLLELSEREIEHVLLHELAHVKRGDLKVHAVYMLLQIVYWFNPLLWFVRRQLQHLRELCCDATVARLLREETGGYRETILETARRLLAKPVEPGMGLLGLFEDSNKLSTRLRWLEKKTWKYRPLRIATVFAIVAFMAACVLPMAARSEPEEKSEVGAQKSEFSATLPNGAVVELVGLGTAPWKSEQRWWRPDGVEMDKPEFKVVGPIHEWPERPNGLQFQCTALLKFSNQSGKDVTVPKVEFSDKPLSGGLVSGIADDGSQFTYIVSLPHEDAIPNETDVSVAIGTGPFKQVIRPPSEFSEKTYESYWLEDKESEIIRHPVRTDHYHGTLAVDLTLPEKDVEFRVLAKLNNGETEKWSGGGSVGDKVKWFAATPRRENLKVEDINDLIVEYRPYQWVTFKNVSLKPNFKTGVKVEVEEPNEKPEGRSQKSEFSATLANGVTVELVVLDSDGDGLSDFQEVHKYLTDPAEKDSDGDGISDGEWDERREYGYSVRTVVRYMPPFDEKALNDDYQDARVLSRTDDLIEIEVVHYPFSTAGGEIQANLNWQKDCAKMKEYIEPGITTNWDSKMRRDVLAQLEADGIDVNKLTDKEVVEKVSRWALNRAKSLDKVFTTYYVHFPKGRPEVYPGLEEAFEGEFKRDSENYDWTIDEHFEHEVLGKGMYYNRTRGSCTSTAVYLTTVLRAVGIPTRMIMVVPVIDASNEKQLQLVKDGITHNEARGKALVGLGRPGKGFTDHVFNEVYIGNRWHRLNYTKLGQPILDIHCFGLHTHLYTFNDLSDAELAPMWGYRYGMRIKDDIFGHDNPYTAVEVSDLFGKYCKIDNPSYSTAQLDSGQLPNIFIMEPSRTKDSHFSIWEEVLARVRDATYNKTGRNHKKENYDDIFGEVHIRKPGDYLVMLFSLDTKERIPTEYEDLLPKPWAQIEQPLSKGKTVELAGQARDMNIILLATQEREQLSQLIQQSKLLSIGPEPSETKIVSNDYKATLSNGVVVELVGVCDWINGEVRRWRPDGSPLERAIHLDKSHFQKWNDNLGFFANFTGPEDMATQWREISGATHSSSTYPLFDGEGQKLKGHEGATAQIEDTRDSTSIQLGVATGSWSTIAEFDGNRKISGKNDILFSSPIESKNGTVMTVRGEWGFDGVRRIIAIDTQGKEHHGGWSGRSSDDHTLATTEFRNLSPAQIQSYKVQFRPYQRVTFKNVSLKPGVKTDVEVVLAGSEPSHRIECEILGADFLDGDSIEITELLGRTRELRVGGTYTVRGRYKLLSRDEAMLHLYATDGETACEQGPAVRQGEGEFKRTFRWIEDGWLHLSFYPTGSGSSFGGVYFAQEGSGVVVPESCYKVSERAVGEVSGEPWRVRLSNGVTVELVGVCEHPSGDKQWWKPDGGLMVRAPYRTTGGGVSVSQEGYAEYELAARVVGSSDYEMRWSVPGGTKGTYAGNPMDKEGQRITDLDAYTANQPQGKESATVRIGVASGAWEMSMGITTLSEATMRMDDIEVAFGTPYEKDGEACIPVTHLKADFENKAVRLFAVDQNGQEHRSGYSGSGGNKLDIRTYRFPLRLDDIKQFRFKSRPYEWVTFKAVSLKPNFKSDVQVEGGDTKVEGETREQGKDSRGRLMGKKLSANWNSASCPNRPFRVFLDCT